MNYKSNINDNRESTALEVMDQVNHIGGNVNYNGQGSCRPTVVGMESECNSEELMFLTEWHKTQKFFCFP